MELKEKLELLDEMLELDGAELTLDTKLDDLDEWDSIAAISLMALTAEHFNKRLNGMIIRSFKTIGDIVKVMEK